MWLLIPCAYLVGAIYCLPRMARWELAGIESGNQSDMLSIRGKYTYIHDATEEAKARKAGEFAFGWSFIWPVRMMMILAAAAPLNDNAQAKAAEEAELAVEEHKRIIRNYEAAQRADFERKLRE